jgi:hypothetical protein
MRKTMIVCSLLLCPAFATVLTSSAQQVVKEYKYVTGLGVINNSNDTVIVIRRFVLDSTVTYLTIDPESLSISTLNSGTMTFSDEPWQTIYARFAATPYIKALKMAIATGDSLQNAGIRHVTGSQQGINLTIDLCPSVKPLDRNVFTGIIEEIGCVEKPVPIAVAITGQWLNSHKQDFNWLKGLADSNQLSITWINHSYNHYSKDSLPLKMNFLLAKGTDISAEVFKTETLLLQKGLRPSVFFRFPGLVSGKSVFMKIVDFGLIPIGSDAWLSKGQRPGNGSIVLIHANGNDPYGVRIWTALLKRERRNILNRQWRLFDLRESLRCE